MITFRRATSFLFVLSLIAANVWAMSLDDLTNKDATSGLKAALEQGSSAAVSKLGVENGFLNNDKVKIHLPHALEEARPILKMLGRDGQLDELEVSMNRAAESAVPMAKPLLIDAVKSMSVTDAKNILTGGDTSVTDFFRQKTSDKLAIKFLPIVKKITDRSNLSEKYNSAMSQAEKLGLTKESSTVESYVTQRALDGLFAMIAEEEKAIRNDPIGTGSEIIGKVFGALR